MLELVIEEASRKQENLLHNKDIGQLTFSWLHLLWKVLAPGFQSCVQLAKLLQLSLLAVRFLKLLRMIKV